MKQSKKKEKYILLAMLLIIQCSAGYLRGNDQFILWNESVDPASIGYIPNVQYLGQGYNIYFGNPHSTRGLDPGFTNSPAIKLDYQNNLWANVNPDRSYFIPDGVRITVEKSCVISFSSKEISSLSDYRKSISASIEFQAKYFGGKFSASADYSEVSEGLNSSNTQYIESKAMCSVFQADLMNNQNSRPKISHQLQQAIYSLRFNKTTETDYHDFLDRWGTHVITSVNLGSRFGYKYKLDKQEANRQRSKGINIEVSASYFGSSGSASGSYDQTKIENFKKAMISWSSYSIGATPDENQDALVWAQQTLDTPMPIKITAISIDEFLKLYAVQVNNMTTDQISTVTTKLDTHLRTYCSKRLLANKRIASCSDVEISDSYIFQYSSKKFRMQNYLTKLYWETLNGKSADGIQLQQWDYFNQEYQFFTMIKRSSNTISFVQKTTNKCVTYENELENAKVVIKSCDGSKNQQFEVIDIAPELYYLKSIINNLYMTIDETTNGSFFYMKKLKDCLGCQVFGLSYIS